MCSGFGSPKFWTPTCRLTTFNKCFQIASPYTKVTDRQIFRAPKLVDVPILTNEGKNYSKNAILIYIGMADVMWNWCGLSLKRKRFIETLGTWRDISAHVRIRNIKFQSITHSAETETGIDRCHDAQQFSDKRRDAANAGESGAQFRKSVGSWQVA